MRTNPEDATDGTEPAAGGGSETISPAESEAKAGEGVSESGRPDSNRRRPAWEAGILPLNYARGQAEIEPLAGGVSSAALLSRGGLQKAAKIGLADRRLSGRDVVQPALPHPVLQLGDQLEQVVERVHDEQQRLIVVDLEVLVHHPLQLDRIALHHGRVDGGGD